MTELGCNFCVVTVYPTALALPAVRRLMEKIA